ncbi:hypothetical protein B0H15DRAFT_958771 [Mycena belliarum]|uniref:Uncharacterized protein n=1 Tax=Mycena belliarum TaxID=1033014 RepID=A0AAD6TQA7_9AGAR|nr:hypothetical protein B0H15DRAFT_958771 [Mycena belliae]
MGDTLDRSFLSRVYIREPKGPREKLLRELVPLPDEAHFDLAGCRYGGDHVFRLELGGFGGCPFGTWVLDCVAGIGGRCSAQRGMQLPIEEARKLEKMVDRFGQFDRLLTKLLRSLHNSEDALIHIYDLEFNGQPLPALPPSAAEETSEKLTRIRKLAEQMDWTVLPDDAEMLDDYPALRKGKGKQADSGRILHEREISPEYFETLPDYNDEALDPKESEIPILYPKPEDDKVSRDPVRLVVYCEAHRSPSHAKCWTPDPLSFDLRGYLGSGWPGITFSWYSVHSERYCLTTKPVNLTGRGRFIICRNSDVNTIDCPRSDLWERRARDSAELEARPSLVHLASKITAPSRPIASSSKAPVASSSKITTDVIPAPASSPSGPVSPPSGPSSPLSSSLKRRAEDVLEKDAKKAKSASPGRSRENPFILASSEDDMDSDVEIVGDNWSELRNFVLIPFLSDPHCAYTVFLSDDLLFLSDKLIIFHNLPQRDHLSQRRPDVFMTPTARQRLEAEIQSPPTTADIKRGPGEVYHFEIPRSQPRSTARRPKRESKIGRAKDARKRRGQWARQCRGQRQVRWVRWKVPFAGKFESTSRRSKLLDGYVGIVQTSKNVDLKSQSVDKAFAQSASQSVPLEASIMGRRATLSPSQLAEIDKYLAAYKAKRAEGLANKEVTLWKKETIDKIWASEPFAPLRRECTETERVNDSEGPTETTSKAKIAKKFDNYIRTAPSDGPKVESIASGAVDMFSGDGAFTGMSLFEDEEKTSITQTAMDEAKRLQVPFIGRYKPALANAWNALDDEQRATYQARALAMVNDVEANQKVLARALWSKMAGVCASRRFGELEILVLFGLQQPGGAIQTGSVHAHAPGRTASLESEMPEYATQIVAPWTEFVKKSLRPSTHIISGLDVQIERNQDGLPLFPALKFSDMTGASILRVVHEYLSLLWGHATGDVALALPWDEIESDPARYYDASFVLPIALKAVDSLQDYEVLRLARYLVDCTPPFAFLPRVATTASNADDGKERVKSVKNKAKARCAAGEGVEDLSDDGDEDEGAERSPKARHGAGEGADGHEKDEGGKTKKKAAKPKVRHAAGEADVARDETRKKSARSSPVDAGPRSGRGRCHSRRGRKKSARPTRRRGRCHRDEDEEEQRPMQAHAAGEDDVTRDEDEKKNSARPTRRARPMSLATRTRKKSARPTRRARTMRKRKAGDGGRWRMTLTMRTTKEQRPKKTRKRKAGDGGKDVDDAHDEDP